MLSLEDWKLIELPLNWETNCYEFIAKDPPLPIIDVETTQTNKKELNESNDNAHER